MIWNIEITWVRAPTLRLLITHVSVFNFLEILNMNSKVKSIFIFLMINFFIIIFAIFFHPELILEVKFEQEQLIKPITTIGNNQRIISFKSKGKEFNTLCVDAIDEKNQKSICEYKNKTSSIQSVLGCRPITFLSKNSKINTFIIQEIYIFDTNGKIQNFKTNSICGYDKSNRYLFYFLLVLVNLVIIFYLIQPIIFNHARSNFK